MRVDEFLICRINELRNETTRLAEVESTKTLYYQLSSVFTMIEVAIELHQNWPILLETPPEFNAAYGPGENFSFSLTKKMKWTTEQEYVKVFGSDPPTAPILMKWARFFQSHPDFQEEWLE